MLYSNLFLHLILNTTQAWLDRWDMPAYQNALNALRTELEVKWRKKEFISFLLKIIFTIVQTFARKNNDLREKKNVWVRNCIDSVDQCWVWEIQIFFNFYIWGYLILSHIFHGFFTLLWHRFSHSSQTHHPVMSRYVTLFAAISLELIVYNNATISDISTIKLLR